LALKTALHASFSCIYSAFSRLDIQCNLLFKEFPVYQDLKKMDLSGRVSSQILNKVSPFWRSDFLFHRVFPQIFAIPLRNCQVPGPGLGFFHLFLKASVKGLS